MDRKQVFIFLSICLLWGYGVLYFTFDYISMENSNPYFHISDSDYDVEYEADVLRMPKGDPSKFWKIGLGDGFISNIEMITTFLCMLFGAMRLYDFIDYSEKNINTSDDKYKGGE